MERRMSMAGGWMGEEKDFQVADNEKPKKIFWLISKMFRPADLVVRERALVILVIIKDFKAGQYDNQGVEYGD